MAKEFVAAIVKLHEFLRSIVSDRDNIFSSHFWVELFRLQKTHLNKSTAYHPQSDGQKKVVNRSVEAYLHCFISSRPKDWVRWLPWAEYSINTSYHTFIKMTPFNIVYGRDPPSLFRCEPLNSTTNFDLDRSLKERDEVLTELKQKFLKVQNYVKQHVDFHRREVEFDVGVLVYLKLQPYRMKSLTRKPNKKLAPRFFGPYKVVQRVGKVAD